MPAFIPELKGKRRAGLYAITDDKDHPREHTVTGFKIGMTSDIKRRINDYHICFPDGMWIGALLCIKQGQDQIKTKEQKNALYLKNLALEKELFTMMKKFNYKTTTRTHRSEWFKCTYEQVKDFFQKLHEKHPDLTDPAIIWFDAKVPHITEYTIDGVKISTKPIKGTGIITEQTTRAGRKTKLPKKYIDVIWID